MTNTDSDTLWGGAQAGGTEPDFQAGRVEGLGDMRSCSERSLRTEMSSVQFNPVSGRVLPLLGSDALHRVPEIAGRIDRGRRGSRPHRG